MSRGTHTQAGSAPRTGLHAESEPEVALQVLPEVAQPVCAVHAIAMPVLVAVPTVQQAWASSGERAGDRIVAVNGTAGPAEKLLSLLRRDNKKRRLTLVRPQTEESVGWRDSARARRKLFV